MKGRPCEAYLARRLDLSIVDAPLKNANFTITDFSKDMNLSGTCLVEEEGDLLMTATRNGSQSISAAVDSACKAVYSTKVRIYDPTTGLANSWNTSFTFTIQPQEGALVGEFMAFAITANKTVGTPSTAGLYDDNVFKPRGNPKIQVVAVRFFTYWNNVSLLINDKEDSTGRNWNLDKYNVSLNKSKDKIIIYQAWIDYDAASKTMDFYIASQDVISTKSVASRVFSESLDLSNSSTRYGIVPSDSYIGFTVATTPDHREIRKIISWQFSHQASNSSLLATPTPTPISTGETSTKSGKLRLIVGVGIGAALLVLVLLVITIVVMRRKMKSPDRKIVSSSHLDAVNFGLRRFSCAELRVATNDFSDERLLGKGGFGSVYKGSLLGSNENQEVFVAIKRISQNSTQGEREFEAEVLSIGRLRHRNLVSLLGWCHELEELLLVYELMANGSLDQHLYSKMGNAALSWESRYQILKSVAAAQDYLSSQRMGAVHPAQRHQAQQCHARLPDECQTRRLWPCSTGSPWPGERDNGDVPLHKCCWNPGLYCPCQAFTTKTDVYSFGMMALEVVCGRPPHIPVAEEENLVKWVWSMHKKGQLLDVVDNSLQLNSQLETDEVLQLQQVTCVLRLGILCTMPDPSLRPRTERLLQALKGDWSVSLPALGRLVSSPHAPHQIHIQFF